MPTLIQMVEVWPVRVYSGTSCSAPAITKYRFVILYRGSSTSLSASGRNVSGVNLADDARLLTLLVFRNKMPKVRGRDAESTDGTPVGTGVS